MEMLSLYDYQKQQQENESEEIKITISKLLKSISDKTIESIVRNIIFDTKNNIDWCRAISMVYEKMPELINEK